MASKGKQVVVIARISWKHENKVCYIVRSSTPLKAGEFEDHGLKPGDVTINGQVFGTVEYAGQRYIRYHVVFSNGRIACSCPGWHRGMQCYHRTQLAEIEAKRHTTTPVQSIPCKGKDQAPVKRVTTVQVDRVSGSPVVIEKPLSTAPQVAPESIYERMQRAALNGPRAFSLLR